MKTTPLGRDRRLFLRNTLALGATAALQACGGSSTPADNSSSTVTPYSASMVVEWNKVLLKAISDTRPGPPMTARAIGMVHTAMYDAWAAYSPRALGSVLGETLRRPAEEQTQKNKETAISYAAYRVLSDLYPSVSNSFDDQMKKLGLDISNLTTNTTTAAGVGNVAAAALLDFRHNDGANQLGNLAVGAYADYTGYAPVNTPDVVTDPSKWQQLRFANGASPGYIGAHWGRVIPFSFSTGSQFRPAQPPVFGTTAYLSEVQSIIDMLATLTEEQKVIAEYWADGPSSVLPPGHWMLFAQVVSARDKLSLDQDVKLYFMMANAVMDAGIATWEAKRFYNTSRPFTAIRYLYAGKQISSFGGANKGVIITDGAQWMPYQSPNFITPPFPEYTSGHSAFSSAAAEILKRFTGSDYFGHFQDFPAGWSNFENNLPQKPLRLSWATFTDAADQAGISRLYGGIHFQSGDLAGRQLGRQVGAAVWNKGMQLIRD